MKKILAYILLFYFLSFQFSELIIYFSFKINQEYIAQNFCIEKDVEDSTCEGCCQLEKKINEHKEKKKDLPFTSQNKRELNFLVQHFKANPVISITPLIVCTFIPKTYKVEIVNFIFHPPPISKIKIDDSL